MQSKKRKQPGSETEEQWKKYAKLCNQSHKSIETTIVPYGAGKKVCFKCKICGFEWDKRGALNAKVVPCSPCTLAKLTTKSLRESFPKLSKEWVHQKNGKMTPDNISANNDRYAWWRCSTCDYEWCTKITTRVNYGCPGCSGKAVTDNNRLSLKCPDLKVEWHTEKNTTVKFDSVSYSSMLKVWWRCKVCAYEWKTCIFQRAQQGKGCRKCQETLFGMATSKVEIKLREAIRNVFNIEDEDLNDSLKADPVIVKRSNILHGTKFSETVFPDIYLKKKHGFRDDIFIEFDSNLHLGDISVRRDESKTYILLEYGYVIRIREPKLEKLDVLMSDINNFSVIVFKFPTSTEDFKTLADRVKQIVCDRKLVDV